MEEGWTDARRARKTVIYAEIIGATHDEWPCTEKLVIKKDFGESLAERVKSSFSVKFLINHRLKILFKSQNREANQFARCVIAGPEEARKFAREQPPAPTNGQIEASLKKLSNSKELNFVT